MLTCHILVEFVSIELFIIVIAIFDTEISLEKIK
jgi:hypothetical protein